MGIRRQMTAILFLFFIWLDLVIGCDVDDVAVYKVKVHMLWSEETFPKDYPTVWPKAQWSPVFGQSHNSSYTLYNIGEVARPSVRNFAKLGKIDILVEEGDEDPKVYDQFSAPAVSSGTGNTENVVFVDGAHSLVSIICRLIPSPDWFIGVDSLNLCVDSSWVDQITLELEPLDVGAASGLTFTAPLWETSPPEPVSKHGPRNPSHPAAGFYYPTLRELPPIAKVEFAKVKEYSTKELNDLARKELLTKLKQKDRHKSFVNRVKFDDYDNKEMTTKNNVDALKDLEEDTVNTLRNNKDDNNVIVVTRPHTTTTITEEEFDTKLKNMDDVVLAVAHGRRLGLGKHLPRHFRSRLHHAVNKIQPNDCLVSDWSEWTPCSATCGFGEKFRYKRVIREKRKNGRDCPVLVDREHCGSAPCVQLDYIEW